jgi:hypothetical protein
MYHTTKLFVTKTSTIHKIYSMYADEQMGHAIDRIEDTEM